MTIGDPPGFDPSLSADTSSASNDQPDGHFNHPMNGSASSISAEHEQRPANIPAKQPIPPVNLRSTSSGATPVDVPSVNVKQSQPAANVRSTPAKRPTERHPDDTFGVHEVPESPGGMSQPPVSSGKLEAHAYSALVEKMHDRFSSEQIADVARAYTLARDAHTGQVRSSGEPYITHPIAVAGIVFDMQLDHYSVMAALMHDVLEDTPVTREAMAEAFGEEVTHIVDGVSKLNHLKFRSKKEAQAESFRKMLLAMVTDIRVIIIKLADRIHNMRTIGSLRPDKRRRIGKETLEVYAPIATRLGMYAVKTELEDMGFRACYPMRSRILEVTVEQAHRNRDQLIGRVAGRITSTLGEKGIEAVVSGREKHLYSLYNKMLKKQLPFQRVFDMMALRVVVGSVEECYQVLGLVHQMYAPIFTRFKDYIAVPKQNGYQSLHTVLNYGSEGTPVEVQIRTHEMDELAESGIAAHWAYKDANSVIPARSQTPAWLSRLVDIQDHTNNTVEFIENVKVDLYPGEIYVFTPKGRIIQLPRDATPVDFAYAVHSEVGNKCVSAKIDRRVASLSTPLESGQTVEIITGQVVAPSPMWLNSVMTAKARTAIRQHLRALDRTESIEFGKRLLRRALDRHEMTLEQVPEKIMNDMLAERRLATVDDLFADVGLGLHLPSQIAGRLAQLVCGEGEVVPQLPAVETAPPLLVDSAASPTLYMSQCCHPIPGDSVQGFFTPGKGVAVHRAGCRNVRRFRRRPKESVSVDWAPDVKGNFEVVILGHLINQPGALARVTATMSLMNVNIEHLEFNSRSDDDISIRFALSVEGRIQLARIVRRLRNLTVVRSVKRV
ncbi:RelA/SpoT family protein [Granulosicoccus antarcticus]|uniref:guanosine-3',5'-bis(diphosphate) 3'-diphosphatase n=1 Tax=Granulosicoccus antarcticus IMCC3135 TaxID=1192854 RepID=A0A2Z2P7J8_9GAMM|nr:bifunctional (p)ppGpp synthetase/guanosine-3',5'-bis(diphosphate) 3'-pyrophosphohydrolase [Granulosicoccus antarcticus]ASJ76667.1 Bifunctional (p)ppGpp synthase/hydrolase SpoT [Granulosicoccus antarcticus IMCC3135]